MIWLTKKEKTENRRLRQIEKRIFGESDEISAQIKDYIQVKTKIAMLRRDDNAVTLTQKTKGRSAKGKTFRK